MSRRHKWGTRTPFDHLKADTTAQAAFSGCLDSDFAELRGGVQTHGTPVAIPNPRLPHDVAGLFSRIAPRKKKGRPAA